MSKLQHHLLVDGEPLDKILSGAEKLYKAVSVTMGPRGSNVIFRKEGKKTGVTHDGVTVAKAIVLDDPAEDAAADLLKEGADKLDATTGDGTTTVTVLTYHILKEAAQYVKKGENPMKLKLELDKLSESVVKKINDCTKKEPNVSDIVAVATVSSGNQTIGREVGEAVFEAGSNTPIILGFSDTTDTYIEVIDGFKVDSGPASPYLMDSGLKKEFENPYIVVIDADMRDKDDVLPLLRLVSQIDPSERNIVFVVSDIASDALSLLVVNHLKQFAGIGVVRVPQSIGAKTEYLQDIAISTGAHVLSRNTGYSLADPTFDDFGRAEKVIIDQFETIIVGGQNSEEDVINHREEVKKIATTSKTKPVRDFAKQRLMALDQKILSIHVGGQSQTDAEERHYRYEDAVGAARSALRSGVVPGGGTLLYAIGDEISAPNPAHDVLGSALRKPQEIVWTNAGITEAFELDNLAIGSGFDVLHPEDGIVNLVDRGILDPAESEVEAVKTAVTIAGLLLTSGAMIVDERISNEETSQPLSLTPGGQA